MKILITGAGGFLGKRIVERLLAHGQTDLRCMVRDVAKAQGLRDLAARHNVEFEIVSVNMRNAAEIPAAISGCGLIIHAAAALKGSPAEMFMDSCVASRNLLDAVAAMQATSPVRVVQISSFGAIDVNSQPRGALLDERVPMEPHPEKRDLYSYTKLRQEQIFWEYQQRFRFELVVLRPGVIYGPGGGRFSNRVGLELFGRFMHLGGSNLLPLTFVDNCAEAIVVAALSPQAAGQIYNVVDDDLPTSREYLQRFSQQVQPMRAVPVPFFVLMAVSRAVERYYQRSKGQLPAIFTPYKTMAMWGGNRFTNAKLKAIGWKQLIPTNEGIARSFAWFRENPVAKK
ncbi:Nucleoside-diphosphate-sugar epimerase [Bryocella elongata]|uniref:Nucleoside-diphosphate-sugar epimerase n=1 Tax=Bryocella elongata TaxID=863522 RepID=A0A1H6AD25_9BACT|nr:NAD(P)-dependent oxidoreductase [Bryocella elongata]SEG45947.1 Nucleoside-diphosphate-sugar epimerase [Bryocella elongata]